MTQEMQETVSAKNREKFWPQPTPGVPYELQRLLDIIEVLKVTHPNRKELKEAEAELAHLRASREAPETTTP